MCKQLKLPVFIFLLATLFGCDSDKDEVIEQEKEQLITCDITDPLRGATVYLDDPLSIHGEGSINLGEISSVILKIEGEVIEEVTSLPFTYVHIFPKGEEPGNKTITLFVTGDKGAKLEKLTVVRAKTKASKPTPPIAGSMIDERNNIKYKTVQLGSQVWMAENLRYIPQQDFDVSTTEPRYYVMFDEDITTELGKAYLNAYGVYYNFPAALNKEEPIQVSESKKIKGVCPTGWHIPSKAEWDQLAKYVVDADMAAIDKDGKVDPKAVGKALASKELWQIPGDIEDDPQPTWVGFMLDRNNASLFNGIPVGFRAVAGEFTWMDTSYSAGWWSCNSSSNLPEFVHPTRLWATSEMFATDSEFSKGVGLPVRCIKD